MPSKYDGRRCRNCSALTGGRPQWCQRDVCQAHKRKTHNESCSRRHREAWAREKAANTEVKLKSLSRYAEPASGRWLKGTTGPLREARLVCQTCCDLPHRREPRGCPECRNPYAEEGPIVSDFRSASALSSAPLWS